MSPFIDNAVEVFRASFSDGRKLIDPVEWLAGVDQRSRVVGRSRFSPHKLSTTAIAMPESADVLGGCIRGSLPETG
jgi:hypothetical protein